MEPRFELIEKWSFSFLDKNYSSSGIYVMLFPNGKRYLGKTKHFNNRLRQHFRDFSFAKDWHAAARSTFTNLKMINSSMLNKHPDWKRITEKRRLILEQEKKEYEKKYNEIRYNMACDFFTNVQLWLWEVPEDQITEAEDYCLNQVAALGKKDNYYNTVYPNGDDK